MVGPALMALENTGVNAHQTALVTDVNDVSLTLLEKSLERKPSNYCRLQHCSLMLESYLTTHSVHTSHIR